LSDLYGIRVTLDKNVIPVDPNPEYVNEWFKIYSQALKEVYEQQGKK